MFVATPEGKIVKRLTNVEGYDAEELTPEMANSIAFVARVTGRTFM